MRDHTRGGEAVFEVGTGRGGVGYVLGENEEDAVLHVVDAGVLSL